MVGPRQPPIETEHDAACTRLHLSTPRRPGARRPRPPRSATRRRPPSRQARTPSRSRGISPCIDVVPVERAVGLRMERPQTVGGGHSRWLNRPAGSVSSRSAWRTASPSATTRASAGRAASRRPRHCPAIGQPCPTRPAASGGSSIGGDARLDAAVSAAASARGAAAAVSALASGGETRPWTRPRARRTRARPCCARGPGPGARRRRTAGDVDVDPHRREQGRDLRHAGSPCRSRSARQ
jgi:hypothetical protein